jgi:hypothetical protein
MGVYGFWKAECVSLTKMNDFLVHSLTHLELHGSRSMRLITSYILQKSWHGVTWVCVVLWYVTQIGPDRQRERKRKSVCAFAHTFRVWGKVLRVEGWVYPTPTPLPLLTLTGYETISFSPSSLSCSRTTYKYHKAS